MILSTCRSTRRTLGAYIDGELSGAEMLRTAGHVEDCEACATELEDTRSVGDLLRDKARLTPSPAMEGLADGVLARVRAEQTQSWSAMFERGTNDWHWAIVGLGSVTSTSFVTLFIAALLAFGPAPGRSDSLAAVFNGHGAQDTYLMYVPGGGNGVSELAGMAGGGSAPPTVQRGVALATFFGASSEQALVETLLHHLAAEGGPVGYETMGADERQYAAELFSQINQRRSSTSRMLLVSSTTVNGSGL